jgi:UrcA family protein
MITSGFVVGLAGLTVSAPGLGKGAEAKVYDPTGKPTLKISYADLDLASLAGERALNLRASQAVSNFCSESTKGLKGTWNAEDSLRECKISASNQMRPQIERAVSDARGLASMGSPAAAANAIIVVPK